MYGGTCIGCRKISIQDNLPAFNFHHLLMENKTKGTSWRDIGRLSVEKIADILYREKCICLCANCHRMLHDINFKKNFQNILENNLAKKTNLVLEQIMNNINNFKFKKLNIKDPFKKMFKIGEIWKNYLLAIYYISKKKKKDVIETTELRENINRTRQITNRILKELLEKKLIKIVQESEWIKSGIEFGGRTPRKFQLTEKAYSVILKLLKKHPE